MLDLQRLLDVAERAALAGAAALEPFRRDSRALEIASKQANDFVTAADLASERAIKEVIAREFPTHGWLGEETGAAALSSKEPIWIVDPLDGTTNFIHRFPVFSVSVACAVDGVVVVGAIHDPTRSETFRAGRGLGAALNGVPLRVTAPPSLAGSLIATGFPFRRLDHLDRYLAAFREIVTKTAGVRRAGSAALDLAYVAAGRCDGFWEEGLGPWDMAAGSLLIEEAGGIVTDFSGGDRFLEIGSLVAGGAAVHAELREVVERLQSSQER